MNFDDVMEAKFAEEIGLKQAVTYTDNDRRAVAVHEAGHAVVAHFLGQNRRLEVLSIIKRRGSLGLLAHGDEEERFTRSRTEIESGIAIALGGLAAEELVIGESGTGPASDLMMATQLAAQMVGSFGMAGSLISFDAVSHGPIGGANLVAKVLADDKGKRASRTSSRPRRSECSRCSRRTATSMRRWSRRSWSATSSSATRSSR